MILALASLAVMVQAVTAIPATNADFSRSFVVWIATDHGHCNFFMTDAGEDADQLTETLRQNYDSTTGIEILTDSDTPRRCIATAQKAVKRAGFVQVRIRRGTDADRSPGIP